MTTINSISGYNPVTKAISDLSGNTADIVGWLFRVKKGSEMIPISDVRSAMRIVGLDESQAYDVSKENAMRKTMSDMKRKKVINQLPSPDKHVMIFQFDKKIVEELSGEMQLRFEKVDALKFDLSSGVISCSDDAVRDFAYERLGLRIKSYDKAQFTNFVNRVIETNLNREIVRVDDGWYFFDVSLEEQLKKVVRLIQLSDRKAQVLLIPQMKTMENVELAIEATKESYSDAIGDVLQKLEEYKVDHDGELTSRVVKNAMEKLVHLERQAEVSLLQLEAQGDLLKDAVDRVKTFMKDNAVAVELTDDQKSTLKTAKYALDKGITKESVAVILASCGLTLEDIDRVQ